MTSGPAKALAALAAFARAHRAELRLAVRVTVATLLTYVISLALHVPQVLWTVLTAVIMSQLSLGRSVKAALDYFAGTVGGALISGAVAVSVPHHDALGYLIVLAIAIPPIALLAALKPRFSSAPFTAVMVLLAPTIIHATPLESATYRVIEVMLGGLVALAVSFVVLPSRSYTISLEHADAMLRRMAEALRELLAGCARPLDLQKVTEIQRGLGPALTRLETFVDEARRERAPYRGEDFALAPLLRLMVRIRHDLVIIGRAALEPLPEELRGRLAGPVARLGDQGARFLEASGAALLGGPRPAADAFEAALDAYDAEIAAFRRAGLARALTDDQLERLFGLGFALEQLRRDFAELSRWNADFSARPH